MDFSDYKQDLADYKVRLAQHDWFYYFSDDGRVYSAGEAEGKILWDLADSKAFKQAYNEEHAKHFNTPEFIKPYNKPFPDV